ncbi:hypothetical protein PH210_27720 [Paenibacillus sp. BSR1-1]|uniref:hypothetical protein n=1 Tax=Paenibacillus sp. BSR1-1 TaxID=3020845 RepID=UPI0025AF1101|nr:hypothetical protein [Paenibacillus sp. BSR1-1]MDN3019934.1 hypothetical protein [Paenibacillus sp. BSR1-1]
MKEFTVCYTFDNEIITEKVVKEIDAEKEDVEQAIIERMERSNFFNVKNDKGNYIINSYLVRYVRIIKEKILV